MFGAKNLTVRLSNTFLLLSKLPQSTRGLSTSRPVLISIEGNIGAGKSTLIEKLKKLHPAWNFIDEPVGIWSSIKNDNGESLLEIFYRDRKRWSYTFQSCALLSRFQNIENSIIQTSENTQQLLSRNKLPKVNEEREIFITERCLDTDFYVFTKMLREENSIDILEFEIYNRLYKHLQSTSTPLGGIIHLNTNPEECSRRIFLRNRSGESNIPMEYLINLDICQYEWINSCAVPILQNDDNDIIVSEVESFVSKCLAAAK